jgi:hypothetical protein
LPADELQQILSEWQSQPTPRCEPMLQQQQQQLQQPASLPQQPQLQVSLPPRSASAAAGGQQQQQQGRGPTATMVPVRPGPSGSFYLQPQGGNSSQPQGSQAQNQQQPQHLFLELPQQAGYNFMPTPGGFNPGQQTFYLVPAAQGQAPPPGSYPVCLQPSPSGRCGGLKGVCGV